MHTDVMKETVATEPVKDKSKEVTSTQLLSKLLEIEKKLDKISEKLATPLIK